MCATDVFFPFFGGGIVVVILTVTRVQGHCRGMMVVIRYHSVVVRATGLLCYSSHDTYDPHFHPPRFSTGTITDSPSCSNR